MTPPETFSAEAEIQFSLHSNAMGSYPSRLPFSSEVGVFCIFCWIFYAMGAKTFNSGNAHVNPLKHSVLESISNLFWPV